MQMLPVTMGPLAYIDAFSCYEGAFVLERMLSAKNSAKSSCHDLLIQRSVFLLAANHKTHRVVFNLLWDDRLSSPRELCAWKMWSRCLGWTCPFHGCWWHGWALLGSVTWQQGQDKHSWLHRLLREIWLYSANSAFLLTKVNAGSRQRACWHSKK